MIFVCALWACLAVSAGAQQAADTNAPSAAAAVPSAAPLDAAFAVPPYLQDLRTNQVTVMWWTTMGAYGFVEYGESETLGKRADTVIDGMREVTVARHAVRLPDLKPGTRYWYRVGIRIIISYKKNSVRWTGDIYSPVYSFTTPPAQEAKVRCVIFNDTHNDTDIAPLLAMPGVGPFDFSIFNGDSFADIRTVPEAVTRLRAYTTAVDGASRPAVFVRGSQDLPFAYAIGLPSFFTYPEDRGYFAFTRGPVRFVVLDCGGDKDDASYGGAVDFSQFRAGVRNWLAREVSSDAFRKARWHVLVHHIPLYGPHYSRYSQPFYLPVLVQAPFDLAINGYSHQAAVLKRGAFRNPYPIVIGGGPGPAATVTVFEATATGWSIKVLDRTGKVLIEGRNG